MGVTDFVSEIKREENYSDFEKLAHVIQYGLQRFIVKNIEGESTQKYFCCINNSKFCQRLHKT